MSRKARDQIGGSSFPAVPVGSSDQRHGRFDYEGYLRIPANSDWHVGSDLADIQRSTPKASRNAQYRLLNRDPRTQLLCQRIDACRKEKPCLVFACRRCGGHYGEIQTRMRRAAKALFQGIPVKSIFFVTIHDRFVPASNDLVPEIRRGKRRLASNLRSALGKDVVGIFGAELHQTRLSEIRKDAYRKRNWWKECEGDDFGFRLHFHGLIHAPHLTEEEIRLRLLKQYPGFRRVDVQSLYCRPSALPSVVRIIDGVPCFPFYGHILDCIGYAFKFDSRVENIEEAHYTFTRLSQTFTDIGIRGYCLIINSNKHFGIHLDRNIQSSPLMRSVVQSTLNRDINSKSQTFSQCIPYWVMIINGYEINVNSVGNRPYKFNGLGFVRRPAMALGIGYRARAPPPENDPRPGVAVDGR